MLGNIPGTGSRLLALRAYLRAGAGLAQRWSWTEPQIVAFAGSPAEQQLNAAVDRVRREFERASPGFTLWVNPEVRSLDRQLRAWNANPSVAEAAREFAVAASLAMPRATGSSGGGMTVQAFTEFLLAHRPQPSPNLAAPGLSRHGRMNAVDFHVLMGGTLVADTDSTTIASVWIGQGWEEKLRSAVVASGSPFAGPLREPHEPWHYDYAPPDASPAAVAAQ